MVLTDHTVSPSHGVTVVVSGTEAERFLALEAGSWSLEAGLPRASFKKLEDLEGIVNPAYQRIWSIKVFSLDSQDVTIEESGATNFSYRTMPGALTCQLEN